MSEMPSLPAKKFNRWLYLPGVFVLVGVVGFTMFYKKGTALALQPSDRELVVLGQTVYQQSCASCHGNNLEGQANWKKRNSDGLLPAPPHDKSGHTWHHADELLFKMTKFGPASLIGGDYKTDMPGFGDSLSDRKIIAVLSYIKSRWPVEVQQSHDQINLAYKQRNPAN